MGTNEFIFENWNETVERVVFNIKYTRNRTDSFLKRTLTTLRRPFWMCLRTNGRQRTDLLARRDTTTRHNLTDSRPIHKNWIVLSCFIFKPDVDRSSRSPLVYYEIAHVVRCALYGVHPMPV